MASFRASGAKPTTTLTPFASRVLGSLALIASLLVATPVAAQTSTSSVTGYPDLKGLVIAAAELPGYTLDPARSSQQDRPDGTVSYDAVYTRDATADARASASELRFAAARTASGYESMRALAATRDALVSGGWTTRPVPLLGDEAVGFEATGGTAVGAGNAGYGYIFRFGRHLMAAFVAGPPSTVSFDQALGYAVRMSARLDAALATQPVSDPQPAPAGTTIAATAPEPAPAASASPSSGSATTSPSTAARTQAPDAAAQQATASQTSAQGVTPAPAPPSNSASQPTVAQAAPSSPAPVQAAARQSVRVPTVMSDVRLDNAPELQNGFKLGGFSGLVAVDTTGTLFYPLTDRGPNGEIKVNGQTEAAFPLPKYTPRLVKLRLDGSKLKVDDTILLRLPEGNTDPVTRSREITGLPAFEGSGEDAVSPDGKQEYGIDPNGVDTESLALDPRDGSFWIGEEYGPSILHVAADGTILMRIVPHGRTLDAPGENVKDLLPDVYTMRKPNRGFEGLTISPDGTRVFAMLQSPLLNPDKKAGENSRNIRIIAFDVSDATAPKMAGLYVYQSDSASEVGAPDQDSLKIGDISAVSRTRILVGERDSTDGGTHKKVYLVDLADATDISAISDVNGKTIEQATESDMKAANIQYVRKSMAVDLAKLGFRPDKFEGLALVDSTTIAVVNDNDFGVQAIDSHGKVVRTGSPPRLVVIRVPDPLQ